MAKHCETFDHTADMGLSARADSAAELLEALAEGLAELICSRATVAPAETRRLSRTADGLENLTVDFLGAVLNLIQAERFLVANVCVKRLEDASAQAIVRGEPYDPARHEIHTEVKAVTYHLLRFGREGGAWTGQVVLDL